MGDAIRGRIQAVQIGEAQGPPGLRLVPILGESCHEPAYRLLEGEALQQVHIGEVSEAGVVSTLHVENALAERLFLMDGQELVGAKQNRILNTDVLVPAQSKLNVPVSCVEQGRWGYTNRDFKPGRSASHRTRRGKSQRVHESLKQNARFDADQAAVWEEVGAELNEAAVSSTTDALSDVYASLSEDLDRLRQSLILPTNAVGLAVFQGGTFQGLDLFNHHQALAYFWASLVDSYALGWLSAIKVEEGDNDARHELTGIFEQLTSSTWEVYDSPGEGADHRLAQDVLTGSALVWDQQAALHISAFPKEQKHRQSSQGDAATQRRPRMHRQYMRRRRWRE